MQKHRNLIVTIVILALVVSCRFFFPDETPTPATPPPQPVPATQTPIEIPDTPAPTPVPTSLNADGPYVVYGDGGGIWISNPDGGFLTQLTELPLDSNDLRTAISPQGDRLALVVRHEDGLDLIEVKIPSGDRKTIARLLSITGQERVSYPTSNKAFAAYAIQDYPNVAWQPGEGKLLAFMGAIQGASSDLYLYNAETGEISRLTDGDSQAIMPSWSPDGKYILHFGVSWVPPFGGAIVGYNRLDGIWSVRASDGKVISMPTPRGGYVNFVGWKDQTHYVTYDSDEVCYAKNLRSVDATSGDATPILDKSFYPIISFSPENQALLFSGDSSCPDSVGEGVFLLLPGQSAPTKLLDKKAWEIRWMPEGSIFFAYPEAVLSADGRTRYDPPVYDKSFQPAISKQGYQAWEVIENYEGRVEVKVPGSDWKNIRAGSVDQLIWDPISGQTLLIVSDQGELLAASYPDFTPRSMGHLGAGSSQVIWLP